MTLNITSDAYQIVNSKDLIETKADLLADFAKIALYHINGYYANDAVGT